MMSRKTALALCTLILLIAFGLRAHRLAYDSVWWDEGFSIWMGRMPIPDMVWQTAHDAHPPLSYALLHGWMGLVGQEEFALRMQSVLFGVLTVAVAYQIGRTAGGRSAGAAGMLIAAVMRLPVWWSQEVRMYAPAMFFTALAMWGAIRLFTSERHQWRWAVILALSFGTGLLTLYLFAGTIIALNLAFVYAFFTSLRRWRLAGVWIAAQVGALAIFLPWVGYALPYLPSWDSGYTPVTLWYVIELYLSTVFLGIATDIEQYLWVIIPAALILIAAAVFAWVRSPRQSRVVWFTLVIATLLPPILVYLLSIPRGSFNYPTPSPRYFVLLAMPLYVLLGWGLVSIPLIRTRQTQGWVTTLAGLPILIIAAWSLVDYFSGLHLADDYQSIVATLQALRQPGDAVVLNNDTDWPIFDYHYNGEYSRNIPQNEFIIDDKYAEGLLGEFRAANTGVWLVQTRYAEQTDPHNNLGRYLEARSWDVRRYVFPTAQLWFFSTKAERGQPVEMDRAVGWPETFDHVQAEIADGVTFEGFNQPVPEVFAGDVLNVGIGWHQDAAITGEWYAAVKVIGRDGTEIASQLVTLGSQPDQDHYLPVEVFIPPGADGGQAQIVFVAGEVWIPLDTVRIVERDVLSSDSAAIPDGATELNIRFGDLITLVAAELPDETEFEAGDSVPVILYWRAEGYIPDRYKVFVHVRGEAYDPTDDSNIWGQQDQEPRNAARPTTSWQIGEIVADDYLIPLQADAPNGRYVIQIGLYLPLGGQRLPALAPDGSPLGDAITLFEIEIRP